MAFSEYEFEYLAPDEHEPLAAEPHPDPDQAAWMYHKCRVHRTRRFALSTPKRFRGHVKWYGLQYSSGRVTIWHPDGSIVGNYRGVDSARKRLNKGRYGLWLVWLEPATPHGPAGLSDSRATLEQRGNPAAAWTMTIGFTAYGPAGARVTAMDTAEALAEFLPGFDRRALAIHSDDDPSLVTPVYCTNPACRLEPGHPPPCEDDHGPQPDDHNPPPQQDEES